MNWPLPKSIRQRIAEVDGSLEVLRLQWLETDRDEDVLCYLVQLNAKLDERIALMRLNGWRG